MPCSHGTDRAVARRTDGHEFPGAEQARTQCRTVISGACWRSWPCAASCCCGSRRFSGCGSRPPARWRSRATRPPMGDFQTRPGAFRAGVAGRRFPAVAWEHAAGGQRYSAGPARHRFAGRLSLRQNPLPGKDAPGRVPRAKAWRRGQSGLPLPAHARALLTRQPAPAVRRSSAARRPPPRSGAL